MTHGLDGVFVGLGANLGDPVAQLRLAVLELDRLPQTRVVRASRIFRTAAWGGQDQPDYANAVVELETSLEPEPLLRQLLEIEQRAGRSRDGIRWAPRLLDLDLLVHRDAVLDVPGCHVPHPHIHQRAFVLVPLAELAPDLIVHGQGQVRQMLARVDASDVRAWNPDPRLADVALVRDTSRNQ